MLLERNEILQKYADLTSEKGDMYIYMIKRFISCYFMQTRK